MIQLEAPRLEAAVVDPRPEPPSGDVTVSILDDQNRVIRTLPAPKAAGLNRIHWDLRDEPSSELRLRTSPLYAPEITVGPDGTRPGVGGPRISILMPPGAYTVFAWNESTPLESRRLAVPEAGGDVEVNFTLGRR